MGQRHRSSTPSASSATGRLLGPGDDQPGCPSPAAVVERPLLAAGARRRREVATRATITVDGTRFPIIGVTPASFFGVDVGRRFDVAVPLCSEDLIAGSPRTQTAPHLVARHRRPAGARLDAREGERASRRDFRRNLRIDGARDLRRDPDEELPHSQAAGPSRDDGLLGSPGGLRRSSLAVAGHLGPRAPHRLAPTSPI